MRFTWIFETHGTFRRCELIQNLIFVLFLWAWFVFANCPVNLRPDYDAIIQKRVRFLRSSLCIRIWAALYYCTAHTSLGSVRVWKLIRNEYVRELYENYDRCSFRFIRWKNMRNITGEKKFIIFRQRWK